MTLQCPAQVEHSEDADIDVPLEVPPAAASAAAAAQQAAAGRPETSQPVVGVPTDASLVVHPDGRAAPAHVVGVQGETKANLHALANLKARRMIHS